MSGAISTHRSTNHDVWKKKTKRVIKKGEVGTVPCSVSHKVLNETRQAPKTSLSCREVGYMRIYQLFWLPVVGINVTNEQMLRPNICLILHKPIIRLISHTYKAILSLREAGFRILETRLQEKRWSRESSGSSRSRLPSHAVAEF